MIEVKNLSYIVTDKETGETKVVLDDLSLSFPKGKITVVTGHNGSGKSTLVKLIMGINTPTSGQVFFDGKDITKMSITERAKLGLTMAFQQPVRFKGLLVKDLFSIAGGKEFNIPTACQFLAKVGLCAKDYIDRPLDETLSGGELKRIELAISLAKGGEVFLFDEPEAGIDLWSFDALVNLFKEKKSANIIISHQNRIIEIADKLILLDGGKLLKEGTKEEVLPFINNARCGKLKEDK